MALKKRQHGPDLIAGRSQEVMGRVSKYRLDAVLPRYQVKRAALRMRADKRVPVGAVVGP